MNKGVIFTGHFEAIITDNNGDELYRLTIYDVKEIVREHVNK